MILAGAHDRNLQILEVCLVWKRLCIPAEKSVHAHKELISGGSLCAHSGRCVHDCDYWIDAGASITHRTTLEKGCQLFQRIKVVAVARDYLRQCVEGFGAQTVAVSGTTGMTSV
jgi:hypothetical protein